MDKADFIEAIYKIEVSLVRQGYDLDTIERLEITSLNLIRRGDEAQPEAYLDALMKQIRKDIIRCN